MTDEQIALARRAVACRGWRWMGGMLAVEWTAPGMSLTGGRPFRVDERWHEVGVWLPDLTDPATLGCVLALVRVAFNDDGIGAIRQFVGLANGGCMWSLIGFGGELGKYYASEGEALVAALEAAP